MLNFDRSEVNEKIQKTFLNQLQVRARKMRRCYAERRWLELKEECERVRQTAEANHFNELAQTAAEMSNALGQKSTIMIPAWVPEVRELAERLFAKIDEALINP